MKRYLAISVVVLLCASLSACRKISDSGAEIVRGVLTALYMQPDAEMLRLIYQEDNAAYIGVPDPYPGESEYEKACKERFGGLFTEEQYPIFVEEYGKLLTDCDINGQTLEIEESRVEAAEETGRYVFTVKCRYGTEAEKREISGEGWFQFTHAGVIEGFALPSDIRFYVANRPVAE